MQGFPPRKLCRPIRKVWEQIETTSTRILRSKDGQKQIAKISKAALGSFRMRINGKGNAIRVRRVR